MLVTITGPSGSGKTTLVHKLLDEYPGLYAESLGCTSRAPRPTEKDGEDYWFVSREYFEENKHLFLETNEYNGNMYGTLSSAVDSALEGGRRVLYIADPTGAEAIWNRRTHLPYLTCQVYLHVDPPEALRRLKKPESGRTEDEAKERIRLDREYFASIPMFFYDYVIHSTETSDEVSKVHKRLDEYKEKKDGSS